MKIKQIALYRVLWKKTHIEIKPWEATPTVTAGKQGGYYHSCDHLPYKATKFFTSKEEAEKVQKDLSFVREKEFYNSKENQYWRRITIKEVEIMIYYPKACNINPPFGDLTWSCPCGCRQSFLEDLNSTHPDLIK